MSDIVERLHNYLATVIMDGYFAGTIAEAADEIERLRGHHARNLGWEKRARAAEAALREVGSQCHNLPRGATADRINTIARAALEGK